MEYRIGIKCGKENVSGQIGALGRVVGYKMEF
jgi:hypothetical protein